MDEKSCHYSYMGVDITLPDGSRSKVDMSRVKRMQEDEVDLVLKGEIPLTHEHVPEILDRAMNGQVELTGLEVKTLYDCMNTARKRRYDVRDESTLKDRIRAEKRARWTPPLHSGFSPVVDFLMDNDWLVDQHMHALKVFVLGYIGRDEICDYAFYSLERFWHVLMYDVITHDRDDRDKESDEFKRMEQYYELRAKYENEKNKVDPNERWSFAKGAIKSPVNDILNDFSDSRDAHCHCDWAAAMMQRWMQRRSFANYMMVMFSEYIFEFPLGDMEQTAKDFVENYRDDACAEKTLDIVDEWIRDALMDNPKQNGTFGCVNLMRMLCIACLDDSAKGIGLMIWRQAMALDYCKRKGLNASNCWEFQELGMRGIERFRMVPNPFAGY